jgi:hypothetical protein
MCKQRRECLRAIRKFTHGYPQYPQEGVDKMGYPQGVVDCVDNSMSTYSLHTMCKRVIRDRLVHG